MVMITQEYQSSSHFAHPEPISPLGAGVSPVLRRWVLGRDSFRCQAPGCGRSASLDVFQINPNQAGGHYNPANLITVCSHCLPLWDLMGRGKFIVEERAPLALGSSRPAVNQ